MTAATTPRHMSIVHLSGAVDAIPSDMGDRRYWPMASRPHRFRVSASRADGITVEYTRVGGTSCDHVLDAMELAGLGGVVRVVPLAEADAA